MEHVRVFSRVTAGETEGTPTSFLLRDDALIIREEVNRWRGLLHLVSHLVWQLLQRKSEQLTQLEQIVNFGSELTREGVRLLGADVLNEHDDTWVAQVRNHTEY